MADYEIISIHKALIWLESRRNNNQGSFEEEQ